MKLPRTTTCTSRCKSNDMCLCMFLWNVRSRCQSCCKNHPKTGGFFLFGRFFVRKKNHPKSLNSVDFHYWDFFVSIDWLIDSPKRFSLPSKTSCLPKSKPNEKRKSWGECHWNLGEGDWCASGETGGSPTGRPNSRGGQCDFFFFWEPWTAFFLGAWVVFKKGNTSNIWTFAVLVSKHFGIWEDFWL